MRYAVYIKRYKYTNILRITIRNKYIRRYKRILSSSNTTTTYPAICEWMHAPCSFSNAFCTVIFIGFIYLLLYSFIYHFSMSITPEEIKKKTTSSYATVAAYTIYKMMRVGVYVDVLICMWKRTTYIIVLYIYQPTQRVSFMVEGHGVDGTSGWCGVLIVDTCGGAHYY